MTEMASTTFRDTAGNIWSCQMTVRQVRRLKDDCDFSVTAIGDPNVLDRLVQDNDQVLDLLVCVLADQLKARNMTPDAFFELLDADCVEHAVWAFVNGCCFFFREGRREAAIALAAKMRNVSSQLGSEAVQRIESLTMDQIKGNPKAADPHLSGTSCGT